MCRKPFKAYLGKDAVYNFINSMIEESGYCKEVISMYLRVVFDTLAVRFTFNSSKCLFGCS